MDFISAIIAIVFAVTIHEFSHAYMADLLGDPTPRIHGRLSLNPLRHFDPIGTLSLILFHIGWGKPVPFNPENLKNPRSGAALIALAGPFSNLLTALILAIPLKYFADSSFSSLPLYDLLGNIFAISILLFSLNILPLPPFDGSKVIGIFVPKKYQHVYERYLSGGVKYVIIFVLFDTFVLQNTFGFSILYTVMSKITSWIMAIISVGT